MRSALHTDGQGVDIRNAQSFLRIDSRKIRRLIRFVLSREGAPRKRLTILVGDNRVLRALNLRFFKKDSPTDVIAVGLPKQGRLPSEKDYLGDIAVSAEMALKVSRHEPSTPEEEFHRYVIHGVLHLLGYEDETHQGFLKMSQRQDELLKGFHKKDAC